MVDEQFNLDAPEGFRGLNSDLSIRFYKRHLPHWRQAGGTYFVTFRLADSIPQEQLRSLQRWREIWERQHPEPRSDNDWHHFAKEITTRTERFLDKGYGECVFKHVNCSGEMSKSLRHFQQERYHTSCFCVMYNHVHLVMKPLGEYELEDILDSAKGFVSRKVNTLLGRRGQLWEQESYDRIIRDEEHLYKVIQYIGNNPMRAGYPRNTWVRWIDPAWENAGWRFND